MQFLKILIFLIIAIGLAIYFFTQAPDIFKNMKIGFNFSTPTHIIPQKTAYPPVQKPAVQVSTSTEVQAPVYIGKVKISYVSPYRYGSYPGEIRISSYLSKGEDIDITGWKLKSNHGEIIIPQAVEIYDPSGFAPSADIVLKSGNYLSMYTNSSPLAINFRVNKCMGYLANTYSFSPPLYTSCPAPYSSRSEISYLPGFCQNYIFSLGSCKIPDADYLNTLPATNDGNMCRAYLNNINYGSCFNNHRSDSDFLSNEWRAWVNQNILDPYHDKLLLLDGQGLVVSEYSY